MSEFRTLAETLSLDIINSMKDSLGEETYARLTVEQRTSISDSGIRVISLGLRLKAVFDPAEKRVLQEKLQAVESTIQDWKVWGEIGVIEAFWEGVQKVAATLGTFLGGLAGEALRRVLPGF